jgi:hypothetical protein
MSLKIRTFANANIVGYINLIPENRFQDQRRGLILKDTILLIDGLRFSVAFRYLRQYQVIPYADQWVTT